MTENVGQMWKRIEQLAQALITSPGDDNNDLRAEINNIKKDVSDTKKSID